MSVTPLLEEKLQGRDPESPIHVIARMTAIARELISPMLARPDYSVRHQIQMGNYVSMAIPTRDVHRLAREDWVERLELDRKVYASLDRSLPIIGVPQMRDMDFDGQGVTVAIVDTGVDRHHPDIRGRIAATKDFTLDGFDDRSGHGTHVAGIIAGDGMSFAGKYAGIAPAATLLVAKALRSDGTGRMSDCMAAVEWAVELGADVINLSLGTKGPADGEDALCDICNRAVGAGAIVCVAAGNDGPDRSTIGSPGAARWVIAVGACDDNDQVPDFSSRGPTEDGRMKPDVVAPGVDIVSCRAGNAGLGQPIGKDYTSATGTSMAAPHVAGLAALIKQAKPDATPQLVSEALTSTAKHLNYGEWIQGAGRVNGFEALTHAQTHENPPEADHPSLEAPGCLHVFREAWDTFSDLWRKKRPAAPPAGAGTQPATAEATGPGAGEAEAPAAESAAGVPGDESEAEARRRGRESIGIGDALGDWFSEDDWVEPPSPRTPREPDDCPRGRRAETEGPGEDESGGRPSR